MSEVKKRPDPERLAVLYKTFLGRCANEILASSSKVKIDADLLKRLLGNFSQEVKPLWPKKPDDSK